jgi:hydrogenase maturation factor
MTQAPEFCTCITCSDQGTPVVVTELDAASGIAQCVAADGSSIEADVTLVDPVAVGTRLVVHAGTAIALMEVPA